MSSNSILIPAPPERVWEVLADPRTYPQWVKGAKSVDAVDPSWPEPGSKMGPSVGLPGFDLPGRTVVVSCEPPRRLVFDAEIVGVGKAEVIFELHDEDDQTRVVLHERPLSLPWNAPAVREMVEAGLHLRNAKTLVDLKRLVCTSGSGLADLESLALERSPRLSAGAQKAFRDGFGFVCISTPDGPHATPAFVTRSGGRVLLVMPRGSKKARAMADDGAVCLSMGDASTGVVVRGKATVIDPVRPWDLLRAYREVPAAVLGLPRYALDNAHSLAGLIDRPRSVMALDPLRRVMATIRMEDVIEHRGSAVVFTQGNWAGSGSAGSGRAGPLDTAVLSPGSKALLEGDRHPAVLGAETVSGVVALPGYWHPGVEAISIARDLIRAAGDLSAHRGVICLAGRNGAGLDDQSGLMLRGTLQLEDRGAFAAVSIDARSASEWNGRESRRVSLSQSER